MVDAGRLVAQGSVAELTRGGGQIRFRATPGLDVTVPGARVTETAGSYLVEGPEGPQLLAAVTAWCAEHGVMPEDLQAQRSLEDVFLDLTGREYRA